MKRLVIAAVLLATTAAVPAFAQGTPTMAQALITGRQAGMDLQSAVAGDFKRTVEAKGEVKPMKSSAEAVIAWGKAIPAMFMPGTETGGNTKALPAVWSDRAGFEKAAAALVAAGEKLLAATAADDKAAFAEGYAAMGQSCGACHRGYRAR